MEWKSAVLICSFLLLILDRCHGAESPRLDSESKSNLPDFLTKIREKRQFGGSNAFASANSFAGGGYNPYGGYGGGFPGGSFSQASAAANSFGGKK